MKEGDIVLSVCQLYNGANGIISDVIAKDEFTEYSVDLICEDGTTVPETFYSGEIIKITVH